MFMCVCVFLLFGDFDEFESFVGVIEFVSECPQHERERGRESNTREREGTRR